MLHVLTSRLFLPLAMIFWYLCVVVNSVSGQLPVKVGQIQVPAGAERTTAKDNSFAHWLRELPLKQNDNTVYLYNGSKKYDQSTHYAVINMEIGKRDLQQCADAVMRLRAEYLFAQQRFDKIHFNFESGDAAHYSNYREGYRPKINGSNVSWHRTAAPNYSYSTFRSYMDLVFAYASTRSLAKELHPIEMKDLQPGDVLIEPLKPLGHAVIILDVAKDVNGNTFFLLGQSYTPAQEIEVLVNPNNSALSPWYSLPETNTLHTPEWTFEQSHLKRF